MHLIIGNRIAKHLSIEEKDRTLFLLGSIVPDAFANKELSHFLKGEVSDYSRYVDFDGFLHKYNSQAESHYILGYFTHLIADDLWLKGFYLPWLRNRIEADNEVLKQYHNDFRLLNGKLLEYYDSTDELLSSLNAIPSFIDLEEVKSKEVRNFISSIFSDLDYEKEVINERLKVFMLNQIVGYIETSVDRGLRLIESLIR